MIYFLATRAQRESGPNPSHTHQGIIDLTSEEMIGMMAIIRSLNPPGEKLHVFLGEGNRYEETYLAYLPALDGSNVDMSWVFGLPECTNQTEEGKIVITREDVHIAREKIKGLADFPHFDMWKFLEDNIPDKTIILGGREFYRALPYEGRSCSIYELRSETREVIPLVLERIFINYPTGYHPR